MLAIWCRLRYTAHDRNGDKNHTMTPHAFILKIVEAYHAARVPAVAGDTVRRGRSRSISGIAEDLLAEYLVENDPTIEVVYVDQPIYVAATKKRITPDLVIVRNGTIHTFIDLKLDMGWNRDGLTDLCQAHKQSVQSVRGELARLRDGVTKELREVPVAPDLSYNVVMVSRTNINPETLSRHVKRIDELGPDVELFILCDTGHPNSYDAEPAQILETLSINEAEFARLRKKI